MEFHNLYQELEQSTEMIHALLSGVTEQEARVKPNAESWSMLEVTCHLCDEERADFRQHLDFILSAALKPGLPRQDKVWLRLTPRLGLGA